MAVFDIMHSHFSMTQWHEAGLVQHRADLASIQTAKAACKQRMLQQSLAIEFLGSPSTSPTRHASNAQQDFTLLSNSPSASPKHHAGSAQQDVAQPSESLSTNPMHEASHVQQDWALSGACVQPAGTAQHVQSQPSRPLQQRAPLFTEVGSQSGMLQPPSPTQFGRPESQNSSLLRETQLQSDLPIVLPDQGELAGRHGAFQGQTEGEGHSAAAASSISQPPSPLHLHHSQPAPSQALPAPPQALPAPSQAVATQHTTSASGMAVGSTSQPSSSQRHHQSQPALPYTQLSGPGVPTHTSHTGTAAPLQTAGVRQHQQYASSQAGISGQDRSAEASSPGPRPAPVRPSVRFVTEASPSPEKASIPEGMTRPWQQPHGIHSIPQDALGMQGTLSEVQDPQQQKRAELQVSFAFSGCLWPIPGL